MASLGAALMAGLLASCATAPQGQEEPGGVLFVYVALPAWQIKQPESIDAVIERLDLLRQPFLELHPSVRIQLIPFAEDQLIRQVRRRNWEGLGPDLLLVTDRMARDLRRLDLSRPATAPADLLSQLDPTAVQRLRQADGQLAGLPMLLETEQACFNRSLLPDSPTNLQALLQVSAAGVPVGLSLMPRDLAWLLGGFGADEAIAAAARGETPRPQGRAALVQLLQWLADANLQEQVSVFTAEEPMLRRFAAGELAWIPCRSSDLTRLRRSLAADLGVAGLPRGPRGEATPINTLRVWAFGSNSSARQRRTAERWTSFSITPIVQRRLTLQTRGSLPVNQVLPVPVDSSAILRTLEATRQQASRTAVADVMREIDGEQLAQMQRLINDVAFQTLAPETAAEHLFEALITSRRAARP
jgi:arabinogalactan oligomer / maltooligosaccharide transport system substrate-binding protein